MNAIHTMNLEKKYGDFTAVSSLDLEILEGEFFALLGSNGAGKTTTIKMLSCLLRPTGGDAEVLGESIIGNPEYVKENINLSPQETSVALNLSVSENLMMIAQIYGDTKNQAKEKCAEMMETFGLSDKKDTKAKRLSGGWQRRLSIAMALITSPKILFLDEPTLGLDVRARRELWKTIEKLRGKVTLILTTHYLEEAEKLADRICIMNKGKVQILGTVTEILQQSGEKNFEEAFLKYTDEGDLK